ncbi:dihydroorotase [Myroides guanonis]|uniref:Dihydroorotase n=1 Tax=Myroides guanonis TaxID=1150112 RepID=A0A1I3UQ07_9FLAO|nr:dihydroorotase [Myroides guanonis]SFJ85398.1 dihydroorotase [Myroides guanonis]
MQKYLIKNGIIVNEGIQFTGDVLIEDGVISKIDSVIENIDGVKTIDASDCYVIPGMIDDQVHFREPGLTHKGDIETESRAAIMGGITSYIEQPNTVPNAVTQELLQDKYDIAARKSYANYSFMMGGTNDNLAEVLKTNPRNVAGVKLFLGSSTGNMLVDNQEVLEKIFSSTSMLIAVHAEDEATIKANLAIQKDLYGDAIPVQSHPIIRSAEACYLSSSKAVALAEKTGARLHVFHVSTARETELFRNDIPLKDKKITAEVCVHHLWFTDADYDVKGNFIKWNPAVKSAEDREGLWKALLDDRIDVIATDHAPHTLEEKSKSYSEAPSGGPLVQHALIALFEAHKNGRISVEKIVEKTAHNPSIVFQIEKRGFLKKGYHADVVIVNPKADWVVSKENVAYKCGWSPFEGQRFHSEITHTFVNGKLVFENGVVASEKAGERMLFER